MNKLVIPAILAATVMVAGMFAFMPVEQDSTVHTTVVTDITQDIGGASAIVSSDPVSNTFAGADTVFHYVIMESTEAFTIKDIEITSTIDGDLADNADSATIQLIEAFPAEYASTAAGVTDAEGDGHFARLCQGCADSVRGDDTLNTVTFSLNAAENDSGSADNWSFGPNTKIFIQIDQSEDNGDAGDISSTVTFYLSGPVAADITITEFEDQANLD